ncbi:hypothetical protein GCM10023178_00810 [Actinomadura luteofluorescens]
MVTELEAGCGRPGGAERRRNVGEVGASPCDGPNEDGPGAVAQGALSNAGFRNVEKQGLPHLGTVSRGTVRLGLEAPSGVGFRPG